MKILIIIIFAFIGLMSASSATTSAPASSDMLPFYSVVVRNGVIVVTLPDSPRWVVFCGIDDRRLTKPGETFALKDGALLQLVGHHLSYLVTAQLAPTAGLKIESHFNASSFGGTPKNRTYFIPCGCNTPKLAPALKELMMRNGESIYSQAAKCVGSDVPLGVCSEVPTGIGNCTKDRSGRKGVGHSY